MEASGQITKKRTAWIDAAKFAAMLAVITDHTANILYTDIRIGYITYFSVSVFILLMGLTAYQSLQKNRFRVQNRITGIFFPYTFATFVCTVAEGGFSFDFEVFLKHMVRFDASGPFYYVLLYMQLVIAAPVFYRLLQNAGGKKYPVLRETALLIPIVLLSVWTSRNTNILNIYGGGGRLLGGSYLILLYLGMWFAKYQDRIRPGKTGAFLLVIVSLALVAVFGYLLFTSQFFLDGQQIFGLGINPPGITLCLDAVLITLLFFALGKQFDHFPGSFAAKAFSAFAVPGRHTLYIFLYHYLIITAVLLPVHNRLYTLVKNFNIVRVIYYAAIISGSIAMEFLCRAAARRLASCYRDQGPAAGDKPRVC